jgi:hypothetical protein
MARPVQLGRVDVGGSRARAGRDDRRVVSRLARRGEPSRARASVLQHPRVHDVDRRARAYATI